MQKTVATDKLRLCPPYKLNRREGPEGGGSLRGRATFVRGRGRERIADPKKLPLGGGVRS